MDIEAIILSGLFHSNFYTPGTCIAVCACSSCWTVLEAGGVCLWTKESARLSTRLFELVKSSQLCGSASFVLAHMNSFQVLMFFDRGRFSKFRVTGFIIMCRMLLFEWSWLVVGWLVRFYKTFRHGGCVSQNSSSWCWIHFCVVLTWHFLTLYDDNNGLWIALWMTKLQGALHER